MDAVVFLDKVRVAPEEARVSVFDHGFLFGDSVYEVVRTLHGRLFASTAHVKRLFNSARQLQLDVPMGAEDLGEHLSLAAAAVREAHPETEVYVRVIVTRGEGEIELSPESCDTPHTIVIARPLPPYPEEHYRSGVAVAIVGTMRNPVRSVNPNIKSGNYLNNVLAYMEARRAGADEAVMLNENGFLTECTTSNIFLVKGEVVKTPSLESGILSGITRSIVIDLAREEGMEVLESKLRPLDLREADEAFITSTTRDIMPVREVDGKPIGDEPGPVTRVLMERFAECAGRFLEGSGGEAEEAATPSPVPEPPPTEPPADP